MNEFEALLSRRQVLQRATVLGVGGLVLSALPVADRILGSVAPSEAAVDLADATLQAVADTFIPGRRATVTDLGHEIHPKAIAGADSEPGAVEADALALYHDPLIGFDALEPAFLAEVETRSLVRLGQFVDLPFAKRVEVLKEGLAARHLTPSLDLHKRRILVLPQTHVFIQEVDEPGHEGFLGVHLHAQR